MTKFALICAFAQLILSAGELTVLPPKVTLSTAQSRQQLLVESTSGGFLHDITAKAHWISSNPAVATVDANGLVTPVSDGEADIAAQTPGETAAVHVIVKGAKAPFTWSFRNNVIPVMTKVGCNQGACHGALAGKNGFKLTLRGYDPEVDYDTLTRQSVGRRVSLAEPASSLMLLKPTFAVPHGGGKRFATDSFEYKILSGWIAQGAPAPSPNDPEITGLEVYPAAATLQAARAEPVAAPAR